jgi:hypothetical protein
MRKAVAMLVGLILVLAILWLLGIVTSYTLGGFIHVLLVIALVVIVRGILGLVYGSFSYISDHHSLDLGFTTLSYWEKDRVNVPVWVGVMAIAAGAGMLFFRKPA